MSNEGLERAQQKMRDAGVTDAAINVFTHYYHELEHGASGLIPEETIRPLTDVESLEEQDIGKDAAREALSKTVLIKLNGGLGTSMGMEKAKSLLPVRNGKTFLDIICEQVKAAREYYDVSLPLIFMNSFRTHDDTLEALKAHPGIEVDGIPLDFVQNQEPKLLADTLEPVTWPADPSLEWCPPGHGDIYTALLGSGVLKTLLDKGYRYAMTSNSDNLGASPHAQVAAWFAASGAPYCAEVCHRTPADRKGGHLAIRKEDGQLILRDTAQTPPEQMNYFTDEHRHPFFHTNNLWFDLQVLYDTLVERKAVLGLPLIKNEKTVDPTDASSPKVVQIECAMGAAVQVFPGATAVVVPRSRFLPVKTTNDLLLVSSDVYELDDMGLLNMLTKRAPVIDLEPKYYKKIADYQERFSGGIPSIRNVSTLKVKGNCYFSDGVVLEGQVTIQEGDPAGTRVDVTA
ncbi:MAG: UTP--glucose-1-phosphate uridylyltransferase [Actinomycetaceae bacterium]|nr:UTP--glucose-1-phosphate uridylyltransferase [Actinomycetaceae bacterium]